MLVTRPSLWCTLPRAYHARTLLANKDPWLGSIAFDGNHEHGDYHKDGGRAGDNVRNNAMLLLWRQPKKKESDRALGKPQRHDVEDVGRIELLR